MTASSFLTDFDGTGGLMAGTNAKGKFVFIAYSSTGTDADAGIFTANYAGNGDIAVTLEAGDTVVHLATLKGVGADTITDADII